MKQTRKHTLDARLTAQREAISEVTSMAGGQTALAKVLGVSQAVVSKWFARGWLPLHRARECEALFGVQRTRLANPSVVDALLDTDGMFSEAEEVA